MTVTAGMDFMQRFVVIFDSLKPESDRGCVLVVSAMVENAIANHISQRLVPPATSDDELIGRSMNCPISSFSAKINLAYRIGIITLEERGIYHQLRELRNRCAHDIEKQDFAANHFKTRTRNIIEKSPALWETIKSKVAPRLYPGAELSSVEAFVDKIGWRVAFAMFFALIVGHKEAFADRVVRLSPLGVPAAST